MSRGIKKHLIALSISGALAAPSAFATNGYFGHGYSTAEKGLAGAGVALSHDAMASATNPAGMVKVGNRLDVGAALFSPNREYSVSGAPAGPGTDFSLSEGTFESDHTLFLIPHIGWNMMIDDTSSFGLAAYGNGGMNADYSNVPTPMGFAGGTTGTFGAGNAGQNLAQLFINASYAKQINDKHALGASLIFAYSEFKADGLGLLGGFGLSNDSTKLTDNGDDTSMGFGVKLGWQGDVAKDLSVGVSYQSKIAMSEFDDYAGLYAEQGDFDIPASASVGIAYKTSPSSTLVVDLQQIYYSDVDSVGNSINNLLQCFGGGDPTAATCLGGSNGAGFGWEDMTIIKVGYEWAMNDMTWRAGISHGEQPIPSEEVLFNILAPATIETHLTFGFTMPMGSDSEFTFAGMYAPSNDVSGVNPMNQTTVQNITLEMDQFEVQGTYTMKF